MGEREKGEGGRRRERWREGGRGREWEGEREKQHKGGEDYHILQCSKP